MEERETGMDRPTRAGTRTIAERLRDFSLHRPTVTALLITLIIVVFLLLPIWWMAGAWYEGQLITEERNSVAVDLSKYGSLLSQTLSRRISLVDGLSAFVLSDTSPESLNRTYNTFAAGLYTTTPGIRNFGVAPGGIQTYVYPLKGNENVPGHNLLTDNRSDVQESNRRMMESRKIDIRGPYELRQGGLGLVINRALFVNNSFWGFCSMVVDMPPILAEAGLSGQTGSLTLAVKNHDGKVFLGDPGLFAGDAVIQQFPVGTGIWEIGGMPASGWSAPLQRALLLFRMTGLIIIGLIAGLVFLITKSYISVVIDLIERKRTEEALRESEKKYRMLFSNMLDGFAYCRMIYDSDGHPEDLIYLNVNCAFDQIIGIKNVTGKRFTEVFSGIRNAYPELFVIYGRVALTGTPESFDIDFKPIGKWLHISVYSPEKEYFVAVFEDITERKRVEEALKKSQIQLAEAMNLANLVNWEFDVARGTFTFNDRFYALYGTTAEREGGYQMPVEVYAREFVHPDEVGVVADEVQKAITATDPNYTTQIEHRIIRRGGEIRHIIVRFGITKDADDRTVKTHGANQDITERKRAEDALRQVNKQLNLLSSITRHDILNQLMALKGYLELSRDYLDDKKTLGDFLEKEEKAARTIERQITFTRDYQELGVAAPAWQNVNASIKKAVAGLPMSTVRVEVDPKNPAIFADRLFEKVFYNLIDNAIRYGGEGMKTIQVSSQVSDSSLAIVCEDDGVGITVEDKKRLFTRGFGKNTGLGLFLTREILSITSITITENGIPGKGARFEITVPKGAYRFTGADDK